MLEGIDKKGFSERKGVILKASVRRFFQSGRVPFEGIRKEFFFRVEEAAIKKERKGEADCCCF